MSRHWPFRFAIGVSQLILISLFVMTPSSATAGQGATLPLFEDFENGVLSDYWDKSSSGAGRIAVTASDSPYAGGYHVIMDSARRGVYSLNELVLTVDLTDKSGLVLSFYHKEFRDESHVLPNAFTGSLRGDGVAISDDGVHWHKVQGLTSADGISYGWKQFEVDLDEAAASAGIHFSQAFKIKFQQYDNYPISTDGFAFDDVQVYQSMVDTDQDELPDDWEQEYLGHLGTGADDDPDGDSLANLAEYQHGTHPANDDTDSDAMPDGWESEYGLDPLDGSDAGGDLDGDGMTNLTEYQSGTDPTVAPQQAAAFPFTEGFETGNLAGYWEVQSTGAGRVSVTDWGAPHDGSYHLTMDSAKSGTYSCNELILTIDLSGQADVSLSFHHKEFRDESHALPNAFTGSLKGDGVAISDDGVHWHKVQGLTSADGIGYDWKQFEVDLDEAAASAGIHFNQAFKIKLQQYDNYPISTDGFAFDDLSLQVSQPDAPGDQGDLLPEEAQVIALLNQKRQEMGLSVLQVNDLLVAAARRHSTDMAQNNFMSHTGSDGSSPWDRMRDAGYQLLTGGENVAVGYSTPEAVFNGWMNSPGHRDNMLNANFCDIGVGYAYNPASTYGHYWTMTLGCQR